MTDPDPVAVYGAALSTLSALAGGAYAFRSWHRARNPLVITFSPGAIPDETGSSEEGFVATFRVRVVNRGSTAITVERFGIGFSVDYRRTPDFILCNWAFPGYVVKEGSFRLEVFEHAQGEIAQAALPGELYSEMRHIVNTDPEEGWAESFEGHPPMFVSHVWAEDVTGRWYQVPTERWCRKLGYQSWDSPPPIVRGRLMSHWLGLWMPVYYSPRARKLGSKIVNGLHRVRLFPVEMGDPPWD
jgi:hypothetical protein